MQDLEKLDSLPTRAAMHRHARDGSEKNCSCAWCYEKRGNYVPYRRIRRWLTSRVGDHFPRVVSDFVRLDWVPKQYRTYSFLTTYVETHTFMGNGTVKFHNSSYHRNVEVDIYECWDEVFYVHPVSGHLHHKPKNTRVRYAQKQAEKMAKWFRKLGDYDQLIKLDGIWYHVYASNMALMNAVKPQHRYDPNKPLIYPEGQQKNHFYGPFDSRWQEYIVFRHPLEKKQLSHQELKKYGLANTPA